MPKIVAKRSLYKEKDVSLQPCKLNNMNTNRTSKAFIVRAAITLLVMLLTSATAWAENVSYIDENGTVTNVDATILTSETDISDNLPGGWYIVKNTNVSFSSQVNFDGNTSLILADGASITIEGDNGIAVFGNLNIYSQNQGTGSLSTKATGSRGDGIWANGNISIIGGIITTTSYYHHGITSDDGDITITGGKVTATGNTGNTTGNGNGIYANGNIILGYTNDTDHIFTNNYGVKSGKSISISSGKTMIDGETLYSGTVSPSSINNKILAPNLFNISDNNDGSSNSKPYIINSPEGLQLLATYVNSGTICVSPSDDHIDIFYVYEDKFFKLNNDIAFNTAIENNFTPIGGKSNDDYSDDYYAFCGSFDGGNHTISGINIDIDKNHAGIFGYIESGASISNITLVNASISGEELIGGIVGENKGGNISNCLVANTKIYGNKYTGAITGLLNQGTLDHNYYGNSTVNGNAPKVGCGTADGSSDVLNNDGAVSATILSESGNLPSSLSGKVVFRRVFTGGSASTICLPFAYMPNGSEGKFYTFKSVEYSEEQYIATMKEANKATSPLSANTPYLFMPAGTGTKPVLFHGDAAYASNPSTTSGYWTFKGTYEEKKWDSEPTGIYGFSAQAVADDNISQGQFVKVGAYVKIRPLRAYLEYTGSNFPNTRSSLPEEGLPDRIIVRLVGGGTSIGQLDMKTGQVNLDSGWYNLDGIRLSGKPTKHGIYVHHGKKVVISTMNNE